MTSMGERRNCTEGSRESSDFNLLSLRQILIKSVGKGCLLYTENTKLLFFSFLSPFYMSDHLLHGIVCPDRNKPCPRVRLLPNNEKFVCKSLSDLWDLREIQLNFSEELETSAQTLCLGAGYRP